MSEPPLHHVTLGGGRPGTNNISRDYRIFSYKTLNN
jgi:hypothetical protein